ncbi:MAG: LysM peptidoglycan-binding domain-containing protein, partial [Chloroflexota bacterium]|nr:LysM peptidoglycan-binding domain-containing protein [Chloroflexota bacterium]
MKALRYFLAVYFIVAMSWLRSGLPVLAQVPVVEPDDVATPTPMPPVSLLPTPTPDGMSAGEVHSAEADIYVVKEEDTLWSVSLEIGVDLQEMPCVVRPDFQMDQPLVIGDALVPPPSGMICHRVEGGETLASIAAQYGVDPAVIYGDAWNQLAMQPRGDGHLDAGRYVRILPQAD